jgi:putative transposase
MPRRLRISPGGLVYHVLNRAAGRATIFENIGDYQAFEQVIEFVHRRLPMRIVGYVLMPNHFHFVLWPRKDGELSEFMRLLTVTHANRWHANRHTIGTGPLYQGRFKSFPIERDEHALTVLRYVDRNPLRAAKVRRSQDWRWGSLYHLQSSRARPDWLLAAEDWPVKRRRDWTSWVNLPQTDREMSAIRESVLRGRPFGDERWVDRTTDRLMLESAFRPRGRPKKHPGRTEPNAKSS